MNQINLGSMKIGRRIVPFVFSEKTPILYENKFKSALTKDMDDVAEITPFDMDLLKIEKVCWQILWVHAKTANDSVPSFKDWWKKHKHISAFPLVIELSDRIGKESMAQV